MVRSRPPHRPVGPGWVKPSLTHSPSASSSCPIRSSLPPQQGAAHTSSALRRLCSQVQATNPGHTMRPGRPHNLTSGRVQSTGTMIPHARGRGVREGRGQSLQRRFSAIGGHDRRPPGPVDQVGMVRGSGCQLTLSSSGRPLPERRPAWQTAIAQPGACARPRRSRSGGCGRVWSRQTRRTNG